MKTKNLFYFFCFFALITAGSVFASTNSESGHGIIMTLLWISVIIIAAKVSGLIEKIGQPPVLGELLMGVVLGNLSLIGINFFSPIKTDIYLSFLSEIGVIILLFQVGLESNIGQMKKVGLRAFLVATIGVICPFILGTYIVGPWLLPGLSNNAYLFLGAALTATSVGITARVFKDLGRLKTPEAQIILGAAVIDDVMGLIILAIVSAIVTAGNISIGALSIIILKAVGFLIGAILIGHFSAPYIGKFFSKINTGAGMKFAMAISFAFLFAFLAGEIGLAPIVGAFAAGLVLDPVHFKTFKKPKISDELEECACDLSQEQKNKLINLSNYYCEKHVEDLTEPLAHFFVPIFFIMTGMNVDLKTLFDIKILIVALGITVAAVIGKYFSGFVAGKVNKQIVGFGMVPRGEVGLIFASIGMALGVVDIRLYSVIVIMVILTTLLTPPILTYFINKR